MSKRGCYKLRIKQQISMVLITIPQCISKKVNVSFRLTDNVDGIIAATCTPTSDTVFLPGTTIVTCSATDSSGNTGQSSFSVIIITSSQLEALNTPARLTGAGGPCPAHPDGTSSVACYKLSGNP